MWRGGGGGGEGRKVVGVQSWTTQSFHSQLESSIDSSISLSSFSILSHFLSSLSGLTDADKT